MDEGERQKAIDTARALEKRNQQEPAAELYLRAGAVDDAARCLASVRRFSDGARILIESLGAQHADVRTLAPELKKRALMAAIFHARAGEVQAAVDLFLALDERQRAIELCEKAGDLVQAARLRAAPSKHRPFSLSGPKEAVGGAPVSAAVAQKLEASGKPEAAMQAYVQLRQYGQAARMARQLGKVAQAADLFAEAGQPFEAAECYRELGDTGKALDNYSRVGRGEPTYRKAASLAVRMASDLNTMGFQLDNFLDRFIQEGPRDGGEVETFYLLSKLYERHDFLENAKEVLRRVLARAPGYRDSQARLAALEKQTAASEAQLSRIVKEDAAFMGQSLERSARPVDDGLPPLPDLPDLPPLGALPARTVPPRPATLPPMTSPTGFAPAPGDSGSVAVPRQVHADAEQIGHSVGRTPSSSSNPVAAPSGGTLFEVRAPPPSRAPTVPPGAAAPAPAAPAAPEGPAFAVGSLVADRYRIEKRIGQGGMATVFKARDLELEEEVALKVFNQGAEDEQALARFKQELRLSRQLAHPNVVRLYDIGLYRGHRFISMELLVGSDLKHRLGKPISVEDGIRYLQQACAGLQAAHDLGIIHRDVKPENFFLTAAGVLKVMDFGIAKGQRTVGLTVAGMIAGTPEYMSPEQINNFGSVTPATDIYSLGIAAFEIFTGRLPFQHPELMPLLMMHLQQAPPAPRGIKPELAPELEQVILRCLEKDATRRYKSCRELSHALEQVADPLGI